MGATVLKPGASTSFTFPFQMMPGMGGKHHFVVHIKTNDKQHPDLVFDVYANAVENQKK